MKKKAKKQSALTSAADALIAQAQRGRYLADPSAEAVATLEKVLTYNDGAPRLRRVPVDAVLEMLRGLGWSGGRQALDSFCRRRFGRRSYGTP